MAVLDLGCGPGRLTVPLARCVGGHGQVVAVDIQDGMLDRARDKARDTGLANIQFVCASAGDGALGRDRFDRAFMVTVLGEIADRDAAMREIFHALKPGGILSVTEVTVGFRETARHGTRMAFTLILQKPGDREAISAM
jgi:ubiquinone/menaquinone biosynthesis C-methylase UbiE